MPQKHLPKVLATLILLIIGVIWVNHRFAGPQPPSTPDFTNMIRNATAAERAAAISSITNQLVAFKKDDYKAATFYQSSGLKHNFASVAAFRSMMKQSYPQFTNYKSVTFGQAQTDAKGVTITLPVELTGQDGVKVQARYFMVKEAKVFKVAGVQGGMVAHPMPPHPITPRKQPAPASAPIGA